MNEFSDAEWIHSRKITVKSVARHFAPWKSRFFILDKANAALGIKSSSKGGLTVVPLSSPSLVIQRHEYGGEDQFLLTLLYKEDFSSTVKEIVMKFDSLEHLLYWEKGLKSATDSVKTVTAGSTLALFQTLIEYINEKLQLQLLADSESQYEAKYFDKFTLSEHAEKQNNYLSDSIDAAFLMTSRSDCGTEEIAGLKGESTCVEPVSEFRSVQSPIAPAIALRPFGVPRMHILLIAVGTRGDMQPFVQLGMRLQQDGHRVRVATHACFRKHVVEKGLEFYPLAGDPLKLSEFMVKTQGFVIPTSPELLMEAPIYHRMVVDMMYSCWGACVDPDPEDPDHRKFVAEAIISNPVSYAHAHCAEALGIPMHLMFPQPWTPTKAFPHPLSCLSYKQGWSAENYISYQLVDSMMWMSFERHINAFRVNVLGLEPLRVGEGGWNHLNTMKVPFVKMWSPSFVPKPKDWPSHVDVVGTFFDNVVKPKKLNQCIECSNPSVEILQSKPNVPTLKVDFKPAPELAKFLESGDAPIFVGFGSMVVKNLEGLISLFLEGAALAGVRIIVQLGWSEISSERFMELALQAQFKASVVREAENFHDPLGSSLIFPSGRPAKADVVTLTTTAGISKSFGGLGDLSMSMRSVESSSTVDEGSHDESTLDGEALANASERASESNMYTSSLSASAHYPPSSGPRSNSSDRHSSNRDSLDDERDFDLSPMSFSEYRKSRENSRDRAKGGVAAGDGVAIAGGSGLGKWLLGAANSLTKSFQSSRPTSGAEPTTSVPSSERVSASSLRDGWDEVEVTGWSASKDAIFIGPCPHDWLFQQVAGVVHHGGAGTTAAGLRFGRPTWICPFFGDQHFWGEMVHRRKVGPKPCPIGALSLDVVTDSLLVLKSEDTIANAAALADNMSHEDGVEGACRAFYKHLPLENMLCDVSIFQGEYRMAQDCGLKMCQEVSDALHSAPSLHMQDHRLAACCYKDWTRPAPHSAADGLLQGLGGLVHELKEGVSDLVYDPVHGIYTEGISGAAAGLSSGLNSLLSRPLAGGNVLLNKVKEGIRASLSNNLNYGVATSAYDPMEEESSLVDNEIASQPSIKGPNSTDSARRKRVVSLKSGLSELPPVLEEDLGSPNARLPKVIDANKPLLLSSSGEDTIALSDSRLSPCGKSVPTQDHQQNTLLMQASHCSLVSKDSDAFYGGDSPPVNDLVDSDGEDATLYEEDTLPFLLYTSKSDPSAHPVKPLSSTAPSEPRDPALAKAESATLSSADIGANDSVINLQAPDQAMKIAEDIPTQAIAKARLVTQFSENNKSDQDVLTQRTDIETEKCSLSLLATSKSMEEAFNEAQSARKLFLMLGAREGRFLAPRDFEKVMQRAMARHTGTLPVADSNPDYFTKICSESPQKLPPLNDRSLAALIQMVGHGKRYIDLLDFCLIYRGLKASHQSLNH